MPTTEMAWIEGPGLGIVKAVDEALVPPRAWADGINVRFVRDGTVVRKVDGFTLYDTTPGDEPVRLLWHYLSPDGITQLLRVGTTKAWRGVGSGISQVITGLTASASDPVTADQYQDMLIWTDGVDNVKKWTGGASASDLLGSPPKAKIVRVHKAHVCLFNVIDAGVAKPWRMVFSAVGEPENFTGPTAGDLDFLESGPGGIVAAEILGDAIIVYKENVIHRAIFQGEPDKYVQEIIPSHDGAVSSRAVVRAGAFHYFMGTTAFWRLGAYPEEISDRALWDFVLSKIDWAKRHLVFGYRRPEFSEVCWKIPRSGSSQPDFTVIYNTRSQTWSFSDHDPALCFAQYPSNVEDSWDAGPDETWDGGQDVPWDFQAFSQNTPLSLFGQVNGKVQLYGGTNADGQPIVSRLVSPITSAGRSVTRLLEIGVVAKGTGTFHVEHRAMMRRDEDPAWKTAGDLSLDGGTREWVSANGIGRYHQVRFTLDGLDEDFEVSAYGFGIVPWKGRR